MGKFEQELEKLNKAQRTAVERIEGPLLVIAGPGTGKTQLLSIRAGQILNKTDYGAESILCITFTDNAAQELRERLHRLLGPEGSKVQVFTFHGFGSDIIGRYPEYFDFRRRGLKQLDEIGQYALYEELLSTLPFRHPFAGQDEGGHFTSLKAVQNGVKAIKQAALSTQDLRKIIAANKKSIEKVEPIVRKGFDIPRLSLKLLDGIDQLAQDVHGNQPGEIIPGYQTLEQALGQSLALAVEQAQSEGKTGAVGSWRTKNTRKENGQLVLHARTKLSEFESLVELFEKYQSMLDERGLYDYEDMILWVLDGLKSSEDLRLTLAEQYLYIMIDEFQDTNGAQNQLINELSGVLHGSEQPNVMAVGDDDQAIMRFQGAEVSNMLDFVRLYKLDAKRIIPLIDNYRSQPLILEASRKVITQTNDRLEVSLKALVISKQLRPRSIPLKPLLGRYQFRSRPEEYAWVAGQIKGIIAEGTPADAIGVIAPKHEMLISLVPYLQAHNISVAYERRENIIDQPIVHQLIRICELLAALADNKLALADSMLPEVLSYPFWGLNAEERVKLALRAEKEHRSWLDIMLAEKGKLKNIAQFILMVKDRVHTEPFEQILDVVIGTKEVPGSELAVSPLRGYYFSKHSEAQTPAQFMQLLSHISVLRDSLRAHFKKERYLVKDFLEVMQLYSRSDIKLIDSNPLTHDPSAVQVMTAYGAKGREFNHLFIINATEGTWGPSARSSNNQAYVPENLPIYPAGSTASDKIRLLYVAMTRAKRYLYITSHAASETGKATKPLSLLEFAGDGWWTAEMMPEPVLPKRVSIVETEWERAYSLPPADMRQLLSSKLKEYHLSPTHLKNFLDLRHGGPHHFKIVNLLRFPEAKNFSSSFGTSVHTALELAHLDFIETGKLPTAKQVLGHFNEALDSEQLSTSDDVKARKHAQQILPVFYKTEAKRIDTEDLIERSLKVDTGKVRLSGKLDKLHFENDRDVVVVDYKTGKAPEPQWELSGLSDSKKASVHFNRQQLLFYKLLVELSVINGKPYKVSAAELRYVEPHQGSGELVTLSIDDFDVKELKRASALISAVWQRIMTLNFPDTGKYGTTYKDILAFEDDLLSGKL